MIHFNSTNILQIYILYFTKISYLHICLTAYTAANACTFVPKNKGRIYSDAAWVEIIEIIILIKQFII